MKVLSLGLKLGLLSLGGMLVAGPCGLAQKAAAKVKGPAKSPPAEWTPEVLQTLGILPSGFAAAGLNKLTKAQLAMLETAAKADPKKALLNCPVTLRSPGKIHVLLKLAGEDVSDAVAAQIRQGVGAVAGVELVDQPGLADVALHAVVQEQKMGSRTIGFTAAYSTGTPCTKEMGDKKMDVELKGQLGIYTDPKIADIARDLAAMLDKEVQPLRAGMGAAAAH